MDQNKFVMYIVVGLVILGIMLVWVPNELEAGIEAGKHLVPNLTASMIGGDVSIDYTRLGTSFHYDIIANPILKVTGEGEAEVIGIIQFKDISVRAKFDGKDTYTIRGGENAQPSMTAKIQSVVAPIQDIEFGSYPFRQYMPVVVRGKNNAALLVETYFENRRDLSELDLSDLFSKCYVKFSLECDKEKQYTDFLRECDDDKLDVCEQRIKMCGGDVEIIVNEKPDCTNKIVRAQIDYNSDREFDVSEVVYVSFWRYNDCTKDMHDVVELKGKCLEYLVGGPSDRFTIKAGLLS